VSACLIAAAETQIHVAENSSRFFACRICMQNGEPTTASDAVEFRAAGVAECEEQV
jgi:hypothetical protein